MYVYSLTGLTGKKRNEGRMMVVATVEVNRHTLLVSSLSIIVGLVVAAPLSLLFSGFAFVFLPMVAVPVGNLLFIGHQRRGLQINRFNRMLNKMRGAEGFVINGSEFDVPGFVLHVPAVIDVPDTDAFAGLNNPWATTFPHTHTHHGTAVASAETSKVSAAHAFS